MSEGLGDLAMCVLRSLLQESCNTAAIQRRLSARFAKPHVADALRKLAAANAIVQIERDWHVTATGRSLVPDVAGSREPFVMRPYVPPPTPPRRPGSDHSSVPSRYGDEFVYRKRK